MTPAPGKVAFDNTHALAQTAPLIQSLADQGVPVMLLKGAALLTTVYDRIDERPMSDVDLLIRPEHAARAVEVLTRRGCRRGRTLVCADFFPRFYYETELFTPSTPPVRLDLHVRPFRPLPLARIIPDDALWNGARQVHVHGTPCWVPCPDLFLIHLAGHAAFHGFTRQRWLEDIKRLVDRFRGEIDWDRVMRKAKDWELTLALAQALRRTSAALGLVVPDAVTTMLSAQRSGLRERWILRQAPRDASSPALHVLTNVVFTPGIAFRFAYLRRVLFPDAGHWHGESDRTARRTALIRGARRGLRVLARSWGAA